MKVAATGFAALHEKCQQGENCTGGGCKRRTGKTARRRESNPHREAEKYARQRERS
jgi:hypothetical protein